MISPVTLKTNLFLSILEKGHNNYFRLVNNFNKQYELS
jgi:hypothetical protein